MNARNDAMRSPRALRASARRRATVFVVVGALACFGAAILPSAPAQANPLKGVWDFFKGKGGAAQDNADDRERIIAVLTHQGLISYRDGGLQINNEHEMTDLYRSLQGKGGVFAKLHMPDYEDETDDRKAGQFQASAQPAAEMT